MNKEKLVRSRSTNRALLTKLIDKIKDKDLNVIDHNELLGFIEQLNVKESLLNDLNAKIQEVLDLNDLEDEIVKCEDYSVSIVNWRCKLKCALEKNSGTLTIDYLNQAVPKPVDKRSAELFPVKLPSLNIERFSGDPTDFKRFWDQFEAAIDSNIAVAKVDKFNYLKSYLFGEAASAISGFSLTNENYDVAVQTLKERFGNKTLILQAHLARLLSLEPIKGSSDLALRRFYDSVQTQIRNLQALGSNAEEYDNLICPIIIKCLPRDLITEITKQFGTEHWEVGKILNHLKTEIQCREAASFLSNKYAQTASTSQHSNSNSFRKRVTFAAMSHNSQRIRSPGNKVCYNCGGDHLAKVCNKYVKISEDNRREIKNKNCLFCDSDNHLARFCTTLSVEEKRDVLKRDKRCYKCLIGKHLVRFCRVKINPCTICGSVYHNEIFCQYDYKSRLNNVKESISQESLTNSSEADSDQVVSNIGTTNSNVEGSNLCVLPTCVVGLQGARGLICENALMVYDTASSITWITKDVFDRLDLRVVRNEVLEMYTFGNKPEKKEFKVTSLILFNKNDPNKRTRIEAHVTDTISHVSFQVPKQKIESLLKRSKIPLSEVNLADQGKTISVLLGCDILWKFFSGDKIELAKDLYCIDTFLGYVVSGSLNSDKMRVSAVNLCLSERSLSLNNDLKIADEDSAISISELNSNMKKLWELDNMFIEPVAEDRSTSEIDLQILKCFEDDIKFENGRYEVQLPFKSEVNLDDNFQLCKRRLSTLVARFSKDLSLYKNYCSVFEEQLKLGIIEEVSPESDQVNFKHYLPHHPVIKSDKDANRTRFRIVFDASARERGSLSLNENLNAGPNLNPNLLLLLLKFRKGEIGIVADIEKAFLRVLLSPESRDCQRFLWVDKMPPGKLKVFRNKTVCFGVKPSPFLLAATIKHHIRKYEVSNPIAFKALNENLYVDDLITSENTLEKAILVSGETKQILSEASMNLREFKTNSTALQTHWQKVNDEKVDSKNMVTIKVLGCLWDTRRDYLQFDVNAVLKAIEDAPCTKRAILKISYAVYDPIGALLPFTIRTKILLQVLWQRGIGWDETLPDDLLGTWKTWCSEIHQLQEVEVPRFYFKSSNKSDCDYEVHVFCDASEKAYGAISYVRYHSESNDFRVAFVTAKARVAPIKKVTLPRLELLAAVVGARILRSLRDVFTINDNYVMWSDSTVALHWIKGDARVWKPFVCNRVTEIQEYTNPAQWRHCRGSENPADLLSRGVPARELIGGRRWFHATPWLKFPDSEWPRGTDVDSCSRLAKREADHEKRSNTVSANVAVAEYPDEDFTDRFSSWSRLRRTTAWCLRFGSNCKGSRASGTLSTEELKAATRCIVRMVQRTNFKAEIDVLRKNQLLGSTSRLRSLAPFLDDEDVLRVGGRLANSSLPDAAKHPILIPKNHPVAELIVRHHHVSNLHGGLQLTSSAVRQCFWIVGATRMVKRVLARCVRCHRLKATTATQVMSDLPSSRVTPTTVFDIVGTDFAGPFDTKERLGRGIKVIKSYICVFVCFATKATHLELVYNLSSDAFIAALRRFTARRGVPSTIHSDCGTNYVGAERELRSILKLCAEENLQNFCSQEGIKWKFNPPAAPHHGGLWEAVVKSMKRHLRKTVGNQILTYEEFLTLIHQVEACLNSRPLTPLLDDVFGYEVLTPGHFIIGKSLKALPDSPLINEKIPPLQRWKLVQSISQHFWRRWSNEYLGLIQKRQKWFKTQTNLKLNDLVLIKEDNLPPLKWKLGRIMEVFPGRDNMVRVVKLRTQNGIFTRPIVKLSLLPINDE